LKKNKLAEILKWIATSIVLFGSILISVNIYPLGPIIGNVGTAIFIVWAILIQDKAMICVNTGLFLIYGSGLIYKLL